VVSRTVPLPGDGHAASGRAGAPPRRRQEPRRITFVQGAMARSMKSHFLRVGPLTRAERDPSQGIVLQHIENRIFLSGNVNRFTDSGEERMAS